MSERAEYSPECQYIGSVECVRDGVTSKLKEAHRCMNKQCEWRYCEAAFKFRGCPERGDVK